MTNVIVSIVIVNYNSGDYLRRCLEYVRAQTYPSLEIIIVDNASYDDSLTTLKDQKQVRVIRNKSNLGFSAAQNQGLRMANGDYLMSLNFDIRMTPTFLSEMVDVMESCPRVGSVCGKLLRMSTDWKPMQEIDSTGLIMLPSLFAVSRGNGQVDKGQFDHDVWVFGAQGAAPLYRREMLDDIAFDGQFFDERYFMWNEDVDLDWRSYVRGWKCRFAPKAVAFHMGHPDADRQTAYHLKTTVRNRWLMLLTNLSLAELQRRWPYLLRYEISLLRYAVSVGLIRAYIAAFREVLASHTYISLKRQWVRQRAIRAL